MSRLRMILASIFACSIFLLTLTFLTPHSARAEDIVVTDCTQQALANAITAAGTGLVTFNCADNVIEFSSDITISSTITIDGDNIGGDQITLDGQTETRLFNVGAGGALTLQHLTLQNGSPTIGINGGAIYNFGGALTVSNSTFINNSANGGGGAIYNGIGLSLTVSNSTFTNNRAILTSQGGAIWSDGPATVNNSAFTGNSAYEGGAIWSGDLLSITQSSFVGNHANDGGALYLYWATTTPITASTFSNNTADSDGSTLYLTAIANSASISWSTIIQPEGTSEALYIEHYIGLTGVILGGDNLCELNGSSIYHSYVLASGSTCNLSGNGSQQELEGFAKLGISPLQTTTIDGVEQSYYPPFQFPALNGAPASLCANQTDQLGMTRPQYTACDFGAIEIDNIPPTIGTVNLSDDTIDEGGTVTVSITATDQDSDEISYTIDCDINDSTPPIDGASTSCSYPNDGIFTGRATVSDGTTSTFQDFTITVNNVAPVIDEITLSAEPIYEGVPVTVTIHASDVGADDLTYSIDCNRDDPTSTIFYSSSAECTYPDNGAYAIWATVSDGDDTTSSGRFLVTVDNLAPVMSSITPLTLAAVGQPIALHLTATDVPADSVSFSYSCSDGSGGNTPSVISTTGTFVATGGCGYTVPGAYTISATASDEDGGTSTQMSTTIQILSVALSSASIDEGDSVTITVNNLPTGDLSFTIDCDINDDIDATATSNPATCTYPDNGKFDGVITASDGVSITSLAFHVTVANVAPDMTELTADPALVVINQPVNLSFTATDVPADQVSFAIDCANGTTATIGPVNSEDGTFNASSTCTYSQPGSYTITASAADDNKDQSSQLSTTVQVVSMNLSSTTINEGESVTVSVNANSPLTFTIDCDTGDASSPIFATSPASCKYPNQGSFGGLVTITDGTNELTLPFTITVSNLAPVITGVEISSTSINEGESVDINFTATDVPADPLSYSIDCDINDDLPAVAAPSTTCNYLDNGDITGSINASDGTATTTQFFDITVNNLAPIMTAVTPSTTLAAIGQPISVQLAATDVPADTVFFTYDCGNGTIATTDPVASTTGEFDAAGGCTYSSLGVYTISVFATDDDMGKSKTMTSIEIEVIDSSFLCADTWNGYLRMIETFDGCDRSETFILMPQHGPLPLCVNQWNGATRTSDACSRAEYAILAEGDQSIPVCINDWNGTMRVSDTCTRSEHREML